MKRDRAVELLKGFQLCCDFDDCTNAWDCDECVEALYMAIEALEQEPKRGKWIEIDEYSECSCCGAESCGETPFCPFCGERMESDEE